MLVALVQNQPSKLTIYRTIANTEARRGVPGGEKEDDEVQGQRRCQGPHSRKNGVSS